MISTPTPSSQIHIKLPTFNPQTLETVLTKVQSYRDGGIRLEHEKINGKHIFHNYGHGSSGVSLAYGSAVLSTKSLLTHFEKNRPMQCAVIGCGLIGLMTAIELSKQGHLVTIYADRFPKYGKKQNKFSSQLDDGLWLPYQYDTEDRSMYELLAKISYEYYLECLQKQTYSSFKVVNVFERDSTLEQIQKKIPAFLNNKYKNIHLNFGNEISETYIQFQTVKIDTQMLIEQLRVEAAMLGVKMVEKKFSSLEDILDLKEKVIFNCMGFSSKKIFPDEKLKGKLGHLIVFKNPSKLEYSLSAYTDNNIHMRIHCSDNKIILKSQETSEYGQGFVKDLFHGTQQFLKNRTMRPRL